MIVSEYIIFWRNVSAGTVLISFSCLAVIFDKPWVEFIICCLYLLVAAQVDEGLNWDNGVRVCDWTNLCQFFWLNTFSLGDLCLQILIDISSNSIFYQSAQNTCLFPY